MLNLLCMLLVLFVTGTVYSVIHEFYLYMHADIFKSAVVVTTRWAAVLAKFTALI